MNTLAVVIDRPEHLSLAQLRLPAMEDGDVVVEVEWSGISTGTERLLWSGRMPSFPGMGYPLVPGYESVGQIVEARADSGRRVGETVFVPGARCFGPVRGLFGGAARRVVARRLPGAAQSLPGRGRSDRRGEPRFRHADDPSHRSGGRGQPHASCRQAGGSAGR